MTCEGTPQISNFQFAIFNLPWVPFGGTYISLRPSIARETVLSSAYSMSPPTGSPYAMRVTLIPRGFINLER